MAAALQIWSPTFSRAFDSLPNSVREVVQRKVDDMGARLETFPHKRWEGRSEFKLRAGDYRVLYEFDLNQGHTFCTMRDIAGTFTSAAEKVMSKTNQLRDLRSNHLTVAFFAAAMFTQNFDNMMMPPKSHILGTPNREG